MVARRRPAVESDLTAAAHELDELHGAVRADEATNSWANRKHPSSLRSTVDQRANANSAPITRSRQSPNGLCVPWTMPTTVPRATTEAASTVALTARLDTVNHPFASG